MPDTDPLADAPAEPPAAIPQSPALAEAQVESIGDLFSRDPEGFQKQDTMRVIEAFRAQRVRWEQAEALEASTGKGKKEKTKADKASGSDLLKRKAGEKVVSDKSMDDLGL